MTFLGKYIFKNLPLSTTNTWITRINLVVSSLLRKEKNSSFDLHQIYHISKSKSFGLYHLRKCLEIA